MKNATSSDVLEALGTAARTADDIAHALGADVDKVRKTLSNLFQRGKITPAGMMNDRRLYRAAAAAAPARPAPAPAVPTAPATPAPTSVTTEPEEIDAAEDEWAIGVLANGRIFVNHDTGAFIFSAAASARIATMLNSAGVRA